MHIHNPPKKSLLLLFALTISACATSKNSADGDSNEVISASSKQFNSALNAASKAAVPDYETTFVRKNSVPKCECPDYELFIYGSWHRIILNAKDETAEILRDAERREGAITVKNMKKTKKVGGRDYPVFNVTK